MKIKTAKMLYSKLALTYTVIVKPSQNTVQYTYIESLSEQKNLMIHRPVFLIAMEDRLFSCHVSMSMLNDLMVHLKQLVLMRVVANSGKYM